MRDEPGFGIRRSAAWILGAVLSVLIVQQVSGGALGVGSDGAVQIPVILSGSHQNPAFSPSGVQLLLTRFHNGYNVGPSSVHIAPLAGGAAVTLTAAPDSDNVNLPGSSWNGATGRVVFSSDREETEEVWTVAAAGGNEIRVTNHVTAEWYLEPSFSPDAQWIVFEVDPDVPEPQQQGSLWKVRADSSGLTQLTDGPGGGTDDRQPNWSPIGDRIVFQRRAAGSDDWNLFTLAPDGGSVVQVTTSPASDTDASWSPDGSMLIYSSDHGELAHASLFVIPAAGGTPWRVTNDNSRYDGAPSWSADGSFAVFESYPGDPDLGPGTKLWRIDLELPVFWDGFEVGTLAGWSGSQP